MNDTSSHRLATEPHDFGPEPNRLSDRLNGAGEPQQANGYQAHGAETRRPSRLWVLVLEMRQRKVCRAALIYALIAWLVCQIAEVMFPALHLPSWALTFVVLVSVLGFPIALVLAWTFEITPGGLALDIPRCSGRADPFSVRDIVLNIILLAASALVSAQLMLSSGDGIRFSQKGNATLRLANAQSVAVLPFAATSDDPQSRALALALTQQLRHLLLVEAGLRVIAVNDAGTTVRSRHADLVLQGGVTAIDDTVLAFVHLVDPASGYDLWSEVFEVSGRDLRHARQRVAEGVLSIFPAVPIGPLTPDPIVVRAGEQLSAAVE